MTTRYPQVPSTESASGIGGPKRWSASSAVLVIGSGAWVFGICWSGRFNELWDIGRCHDLSKKRYEKCRVSIGM